MPQSQRTVLVLHGINYYNAGDHGIVFGMLEGLRALPSKPRVALVSPFLAANRERRAYVELAQGGHAAEYPAEQSDLYQVPAGRPWSLETLREAATAAFLTAAMVLPSPVRRAIARRTAFGRAVLDADVVLSKGGGFLLDRGARYIVPLHLASIWCAHRLGKPVVIYAQTVGPFDRPLARRIAAAVLRKLPLILARDEYSIEVCRRLGVDGSRMRRIGDAAFLLAAAQISRENRESVTARNGAGVSLVAPRFAGIPGADAEKTYVALMGEVCKMLARHTAGRVTIIPHLESGPSNDRQLGTLIAGDRAGEVELAPVSHPVDIVQALASREIMVCTRMHSMIFSIVAGTPFVAISYLPKTDSLLAELGLSDWIIPLERAIREPEWAVREVDRIASAILASPSESLARVARARDLALARAKDGMGLVEDLLDA